METVFTIDAAEDSFRANPTAETAAIWLETAEGYESDNMIQADELATVRAAVSAYLDPRP